MRALAEYVMRGRAEAAIAAVLTTGIVIISWIGAAVVALVTLRQGSSEGSRVLLWALIPAVVLAMMGDTGPVTTLIGVTLAAMVLRNTSSWSMALVAAVASGLITGGLLLSLGQGYLQEVLNLFGEFIEQMNRQAVEQGRAMISAPSAAMIAGVLGLSNAFAVAMCLMLARWWQAMLYNPGGFRAEFHSLRMSPLMTVVLVALSSLFYMLGPDYQLWALITVLPLALAGLGLVHGLVAMSKKSGNVLVFFYIALLLFHPLKMLLVAAAVIDSWINLRERLAKRQT
jgi:hypothetical protein